MVVLPRASHADSLQASGHHVPAIAYIPGFVSSSASRVKPTSARPNAGRAAVWQASPRSSTSMDAKLETPNAPGSTQAEGYGASHTSFYTDAVKQDSYLGFQEVLGEHMKDKELAGVISQMFEACATITKELRKEMVCIEGEECSVFGDVQADMQVFDVLADALMWQECSKNPLIKEGASRESAEVKEMNQDGKFSIAWDALDSSSIVENNWAVGTIIGIWPASTGIVGATGRDQVTSIVALYGPRTTALVALDDGVYEFTYGAGGVDGWVCSKERIQIRPESKIYSPGNMRLAEEDDGYNKLLAHYRKEKYTLRYTGGLVPDISQQFTKGMGIFSYPASKNSPAKLRLALEAAPLGLLVENAGGKSSNAIDGGSILDVKITGIDQHTGVAMGSAREVERFNEMVVPSR